MSELEKWMPVLGQEGRYRVSNMGRVYSEISSRLLSLCTDKRGEGYRCVTISSNGKPRTNKVHILVLEAFVGARPEGYVTRHLNGISDDNRLENLKWGTAQDNADDRKTHGTHNVGSKHHRSKLTEADVVYIRTNYKWHDRHHSSVAMAAILGVNSVTVRDALRGKTWGHFKKPPPVHITANKRNHPMNELLDKDLKKYCRDIPELQSLLYDLDLTPEQLESQAIDNMTDGLRRAGQRFHLIVAHWQKFSERIEHERTEG